LKHKLLTKEEEEKRGEELIRWIGWKE